MGATDAINAVEEGSRRATAGPTGPTTSATAGRVGEPAAAQHVRREQRHPRRLRHHPRDAPARSTAANEAASAVVKSTRPGERHDGQASEGEGPRHRACHRDAVRRRRRPAGTGAPASSRAPDRSRAAARALWLVRPATFAYRPRMIEPALVCGALAEEHQVRRRAWQRRDRVELDQAAQPRRVHQARRDARARQGRHRQAAGDRRRLRRDSATRPSISIVRADVFEWNGTANLSSSSVRRPSTASRTPRP